MPLKQTIPSITILGLTMLAIDCAIAGPDSSDGVTENIIVTGTRLNPDIESIPSHVTVIDRSDIELRRDGSVLDLLRSVAGVHVTQPGGRGGVASVYLRGGEPNFTVVLVDGIKVNDPNNTRGGSFDFSTLNLSQIERIEIARGAVSSVYGSDGLSGIISITTLDSKETGVTFGLEVGGDELMKGSMHLASTVGDSTRMSLSLSTEDDGSPVEGSEFETKSVVLGLAGDISNDLSYSLRARYSDSAAESFPDDSGGPRLAVIRDVDNRDQTQTGLSGNLKYDISDRIHINFSAGYATHDEELLSPAIVPGVRNGVPSSYTDTELTRVNATVNGVFRVSDQTIVTVGIDHQDEDGELVGSLELFPGFSLPQDFALDRQIFGVFGEVAWQPTDAFSLSASLRNDNPDEQSSETTARIGGQYVFADTRVFASWGQGFKLPSFYALGHALVGNPDLDAEKSDNWELGLNHQFSDDIEMTVAVFGTDYEDLIDFDGATFQIVNLNEVDIKGFEVDSRYQVSEQLALSAHVTYVDIDVDGAGELLQRPDWRGGLGVTWQPTSTVNLSVDWLYVGEAADSSVPTGPLTLDSYNRLDIVGSWQPNEALSVYVAFDNAFDKDFENAIGFPAVGARARIGLTYSL